LILDPRPDPGLLPWTGRFVFNRLCAIIDPITIMPSRRALLYVPGDDRHKIEKATTLDVDCVCLDMEDGVAISHKEAARQGIANALREMEFGRTEKLVRINAIGSGLEEADLKAVLPLHPDGIVIPKIEAAEQVGWASAQIESAELTYGWAVGSISLLVGVETPKAVLNIKEIGSQPGLSGLIFGGEDYAARLGANRTPEALELLFARSLIVAVCAAYGLQAIDIVSIDFTDLKALEQECRFGMQLGFTGKQIIHPNQVNPVQAAFTPEEASIRNAQKIVDAFVLHQEKGVGAFAMDGKMIDLPLVKAAEGVLERARDAGKL
jgi:citrate lyase subunit beta-like protein